METSIRWTSADLSALPDNGNRYEIIDGELHVSKQPHYYHQRVCTIITVALESWSLETGAGETTGAPGLIFADDQDVAPDVVWISKARLSLVLGTDGKLRGAPDLALSTLFKGIPPSL